MNLSETVLEERDPIQTRGRTASNQERRNSVSEITEFFQSKTKPVDSPMSTRKVSGKQAKEKEKERKKELKETRENIQKYLNQDKALNANANGNVQPTVNKNAEHVDAETLNQDSQDNVGAINDKEIEKDEKKSADCSTQTSEDEILKAIQELAAKYQSVDDALNNPRDGFISQLAKTQSRVATLHDDIHGAVSGLKVQLEKVIETAKSNSEKMNKLEDSQKKMARLLDENKRLVNELQTMQGLVQKLYQQANTNTNQILDVTKRGMEQNLILHRVDDTLEVNDAKEQTPQFAPKERCKYSAIKFFSEVLNVQIQAEDIWKAHRSGPYKQDKVRPLYLKVSYPAKDLIMEHVSSLKSKFNPKTNQKYYVGEQMPEGITEIKKQAALRAKALSEKNDKKPKEERSKIQIINDKVVVDGELHPPEIQAPQPSEIMFLSQEKQNQVDALQSKIVQTEPETIKSSEFMALATKVHSIEDVKNAYIAVYQRFPSADHIMLGYALKEDRKLKTGGCDDKEYGSAIKIKNIIFQQKAKNTAVFVVRKFGGLHLGFNRFRIIEKVALQAVEILESSL